MSTAPEVLIVGAGPVGLCLACELARYSVPFRIVEKRPEPSKTSKALGIHARSLEMLEDMGIVDRFIERGLKVGRINFYADGKQLTHVNLSEVDSPFNFTLDLPQSQTEALFIERLAELGHHVDRYVELTDLEQIENGVNVSLTKKGGVIEKRTYPWVVGCDGAHSATRRLIDMPFEGEAYPENYALADVRIDSSLKLDEMHLFFHGDGFIVIFPMRDQRFRVVATIPNEHEPKIDEAYIQSLMDTRTKLQSHVSDGVWFSNFRIHHRITPEYRKGRVFLAGDSAHIHSPAGGQGMNTGMQDAYNLAWKLALHRDGKGDLLDSYSAERRPVGKSVVELTDRMTRMAAIQNPVGAAIRNRLLPIVASLGVVQHKMVDSLEEVNVNYRDTAWVDEFVGDRLTASTRTPFQSGPRAGDRAPDAIITHGDSGKPSRLFDLFCGAHYTFLAFINAEDREEDAAQLTAALQLARERLGDWLRCIYIADRKKPNSLKDEDALYLDARRAAHKAYGVNQSQTLYLIRPDGYIAFRSLPLDSDALRRYFNEVRLGVD